MAAAMDWDDRDVGVLGKVFGVTDLDTFPLCVRECVESEKLLDDDFSLLVCGLVDREVPFFLRDIFLRGRETRRGGRKRLSKHAPPSLAMLCAGGVRVSMNEFSPNLLRSSKDFVPLSGVKVSSFVPDSCMAYESRSCVLEECSGPRSLFSFLSCGGRRRDVG